MSNPFDGVDRYVVPDDAIHYVNEQQVNGYTFSIWQLYEDMTFTVARTRMVTPDRMVNAMRYAKLIGYKDHQGWHGDSAIVQAEIALNGSVE